MRAKYKVDSVTLWESGSETLKFSAVTNGTAEDNLFHKFTPYGTMEISVSNPDLFGKFKPGQEYYLDFTLAE